jgi:phosphatidylglycerol:prolipoprotein diacylglycerol transferase
MIPWFQYNVIKLGPIPIQVWGLWVALGMVLTMTILAIRAKRFGTNVNMIVDLGLWMLIGGILGARFFHIFFYEPRFYFSYPIEIVKIWHGGLSSFGGIVGAVVGFFLFTKKYQIASSEWLKIADQISFAALFGWMVGRVGCFMIHDHLGVHSNCPLAIQTIDGPRLDMALIEIIALVPLAAFFLIHKNRKHADGFFTASVFVYYGIVRFVLDFWRAGDIINPDVRYLGLTPAQYFATLLVVIGGYWFVKIKKTGRIASAQGGPASGG